MNWTDEEIDKLFQESASQMNVPYQDAFWTEMEALLPQKEKKKGLGWIFGGTLTCLALIAAMIFPVNQFSGKYSKSAASAEAQQPSDIRQALSSLQATNSLQAVNSQQASISSLVAENQDGSNHVSARTSHAPAGGNGLNPGIVEDAAEDPGLAAGSEAGHVALDDVPFAEEENRKLSFLAIAASQPVLASPSLSTFSPKPKRNIFYAQAGFGMAQSYISGSDKNWMTSVNLGAGYQYRPQGFGFSAGLNLSSSFANNLEITRRSKVYSFSSTNYEQNLMYKQLYSIELPISVDFRKDRHTISFGAAPTYLATTLMRFSQFENEALSADGVYVGQKAGMHSFGLKTGIAYQLEVAPSWNVGIQLNAQMIRQVDETQFVGELTRLPLSGQITIRKTLTR